MWLCSSMRRGALFRVCLDRFSPYSLHCTLPFLILLLKNPRLGRGLCNAFLVSFFSFFCLCILSIECLCDSCSILSKYGVHGFPTLFILNSTMRVRYHGSRTLASLIGFYNDVTGEAHFFFFFTYPCIGIRVLSSSVHVTFD